MSRTASRRLLARSPHTLLPELFPSCRIPSRFIRPFSSSHARGAGDNSRSTRAFPTLGTQRKAPVPTRPVSESLNPNAKVDISELADMFSSMVQNNQTQRVARTRRTPGMTSSFSSDGSGNLLGREGEHFQTAWQLHIYATRHNVHITVVRPPNWYHPQTGKRYPEKGNNRTVALSMAAGNLGFRKANRKHYDSAFQLASFVMARMQESGMNAWIQQLEVFLRGFGAGREACTKALLGTEGRYLRGKVTKVSDATRLKFGGTRSKKPRRLG
ncbi:unnamed protein product [Diplocarpon coronariae]|uniref:Uncharacterized protein n=1 Tax=Diplocarpon coronariae TaxID=2795749 RepID=A0A218Z3A4_9HELO|nr:hypothetical protein JHW43_009019 [Diplocarpon mali]OWP02110.1 hypothetical protein B2J93_5220 [Marssonina coronariae]